jgi:hypothetical protein
MERRQYPSGDARQRILDERDLAHRDLEASLAEYDALLGDAGSE